MGIRKSTKLTCCHSKAVHKAWEPVNPVGLPPITTIVLVGVAMFCQNLHPTTCYTVGFQVKHRQLQFGDGGTLDAHIHHDAMRVRKIALFSKSCMLLSYRM
jgi:hypothetical protein